MKGSEIFSLKRFKILRNESLDGFSVLLFLFENGFSKLTLSILVSLFSLFSNILVESEFSSFLSTISDSFSFFLGVEFVSFSFWFSLFILLI